MVSDPQREVAESMRQQAPWVSTVPGQLCPESPLSELRSYYLREILEFAVDTEALLRQDLDREDDYQAEVVGLLHSAPGGVEWTGMYTNPLAFSGGADQLMRQLELVATWVREAADRTGADIPPFYCALWPDADLNARVIERPSGGVVLVNTGLVTALRALTLWMSQSLATILGHDRLAPDVEDPQVVRYQLGQVVRRLFNGVDLRDDLSVAVFGGPAEQFRRIAMTSALCYVVAHEVGHLARNRVGPGVWVADNAEFQRGARQLTMSGWAQPRSEVDALATLNAERHADRIAAEVLRSPPMRREVVTWAHIVGVLSVTAIQSALWWARAARSDTDLGWTHPYPEFRMSTLAMLLSVSDADYADAFWSKVAKPVDEAAGRSPLGAATNAFVAWARDVLEITEHKQAARQRGLEDRGLNPLALVMLYTMEGLP